jgi:hypothetical protein
MIASVVKGAVCDDYVGGSGSLLITLILLGSKHNQRQLTC